MLVVSILLLVVAVLALVVVAVKARGLSRALRTAELALDHERDARAGLERRQEGAEAEVGRLGDELAAARTLHDEVDRSRQEALDEAEGVRGELRAAEAAARASSTLLRGAQAAAEQARLREGAALEAAAGHPTWVDVVAALEGARAERTWRTVAPLDQAPGTGDPGADVLSRGLDVGFQWLRDVVGTPGKLATLEGHEADAPVGPAALVALLAAQELLDVVGKRVEVLEVGYARTGTGVQVLVSSPEAEHPVDPDGRIGRLAELVAPLGAVLRADFDGDDGPGVVVQLDVPVARPS